MALVSLPPNSYFLISHMSLEQFRVKATLLFPDNHVTTVSTCVALCLYSSGGQT